MLSAISLIQLLILSTAHSPPEKIDKQIECMRNFFRISMGQQPYSEKLFRKLTGGNVNDACVWRGVTCLAGVVYSFAARCSDQMQLDIDWLPATLNSLDISDIGLNCALKTRALPRMLEHLELHYTNLHGSLTLHTLPSEIQSVHLSNNHFSGTLFVSNLPETLKTVRLGYNDIKVVVVCNADLPEGLVEIQVHSVKKRPVLKCTDAKKVDLRVHTRRWPDYGSTSSLVSLMTDPSTYSSTEEYTETVEDPWTGETEYS